MKNRNLLLRVLFMAVATMATLAVFSQCPTNMISYWRLQEAGGSSFLDEKGNHNAIASASPSQTDGISGKGQFFGGSNYLSVASHADYNWSGSASFTIESWVKYSSNTSTQVIIGRDDPTTSLHWWIGKNETGKIEWFVRAVDGTSCDIISTANTNNGQWHHIVAVRDGEANKNYLYVDGVIQNVGGTTAILGSLTSTANITIGNMIYNNVSDYFYTGSVDEVAFYNSALSASEVTAHYNNVKTYQIGYCSSDSPELFSKPNTMAVIGQGYQYDVDGSGNPVPNYSIIQGPEGMTIDEITGVISWTPMSFSQNTPVTVRVSNSGGSVDQSYNIFLAGDPECRDNLIAYWSFDSHGNSSLTDNIGGFDLSGTATQVTGRLGLGMAFDGVNDSLNLDDNVEPQKIFFDWDNVPDFSIEVWMKSSASPSKVMVLVGREEDGNNTQYWLGVRPNGEVGFYLSDYLEPPHELQIQGGSVLDGVWHHIVATYNATSNVAKLYVDNELVDQGIQNFGNFGGNDDLNIGCLNTSLDKFWYEGLMDELAFYNVELTQEQVTSNFDGVIAGNGACVYNFAPLVLSSPITSVNEDSPYSYQFLTSEINNNDVLSISAVNKPQWLTLTYVAGDSTALLSGTADNSMVGSYDVTLRVSDGKTHVDQTFQVAVVNVNDAPVFTSNAITSVNEDSEYTYTVTATDVDVNSVLTYSAVQIPEWLTFDAGTKTLSGTPENGDVGLWDVVLRVSDGIASKDQDFDITVINVNDAPVITSIPEDTIQATQSYMYQLAAEDVDEGDVLVYSAQTIPGWLTFTNGSNGGILTGEPANSDAGPHAVVLKVNDGHGDVVQAFTIVVTPMVGTREIDNSIINKVFPNPVSECIYFKFSDAGLCRVELFDMSGKLHRNASSDNGQIELIVSDLSNGIYIYKAYQNNKVSVGKITKE